MVYISEFFSVVKNFVFLLELFLFLYLSKLVYDKVTDFSFHDELTEKDNLAFSITLIGYLCGIAIILIGINSGDISNLRLEAVEAVKAGTMESLPNFFFLQISDIAVYSTLGIVLMLFSRMINDKFILPEFSVYKEIVEDKNCGTGIVLFSSFVSTSLIISSSLSGEYSGILSTIIFFIIGQAILIGFAKWYQAITPFDVHKEIEEDNVAVGCSFAGVILAGGILVSKGIAGEFDGFIDLLFSLIVYTVLGLFLFPIIRNSFDKFLIPGVSLSKELVTDRNIGLGLLEGTVSIILAAAIYFAL